MAPPAPRGQIHASPVPFGRSNPGALAAAGAAAEPEHGTWGVEPACIPGEPTPQGMGGRQSPDPAQAGTGGCGDSIVPHGWRARRSAGAYGTAHSGTLPWSRGVAAPQLCTTYREAAGWGRTSLPRAPEHFQSSSSEPGFACAVAARRTGCCLPRKI